MAEEKKVAAVKKTAVKKAPAKKAAVKKTTTAKAPAKKVAEKTATAKKAPVKKAATTTSTTTKKVATKKAPAKKTVSSTTKKVSKPEAKKTAPVKAVAKKEVEVKEYRTRKATIRDFDILYGPHVTEKTQAQQTDLNTIVLKVAKDATASEIKLAVQAVFGVKVLRINIINVRAKKKTSTRYRGTVVGFKKAIVKVAKDYNLGEISKATQAD